MVEDASRPRLGRGLAALIGDQSFSADDRQARQRRAPIEAIRANPRNPRRDFVEVDLGELAQSIRERGVLQPILVRPVRGEIVRFEIIAGERRWRAAQLASLHEIPIVSIDATDQQSLEIAIIENVQRADLNAVEEALGYQQLITEFSYSNADLAKILGKSRSHVANTLRLLQLPESVSRMLREGHISAGHARSLLALKDPEKAAKSILEHGLSVRDVERLAQREAQNDVNVAASGKLGKSKAQSADSIAVQQTLSEILGLVVKIDHSGEGGEMRIRYKSLEQLDALCRRLGG